MITRKISKKMMSGGCYPERPAAITTTYTVEDPRHLYCSEEELNEMYMRSVDHKQFARIKKLFEDDKKKQKNYLANPYGEN